MRYDLQLAPGQTKPVNVVGDYFAVVFSPLPLDIRINGQEPDNYQQGDSMQLPPGETFKRLEVRNPSATRTATVVLYAGFGRYVQRRQMVLDVPSEIVGQASTSIAALSSVTLDGIASGNQIQRKAVIVSNMDPANSLLVRDSSGRTVCAVAAGFSITIPTSGAVTIANDTANPIVCYIGENWFVNP